MNSKCSVHSIICPFLHPDSWWVKAEQSFSLSPEENAKTEKRSIMNLSVDHVETVEMRDKRGSDAEITMLIGYKLGKLI